MTLAVLVGFCVLTERTTAQHSDGQRPSSDTDGSRVVTRWMSYVVGRDGGVREVLGYFETYKEASDCSLQWSKSNPRSLGLTNEKKVKVRIYPRRPGQSRPPEPTIDIQRIPFVDVRPLTSDERNPDSVEGKKAQGKLGERDVVVQFQRGGDFIITDPNNADTVIARGRWSQTGKTVTIETDDYLYMGRIDGDKFQGRRVARGEETRTVEEWELSFGRHKKVGSSSYVEGKSARGSYTFAQGGGSTVEYKFLPGGKLEVVYSIDRHRGSGTWQEDGNSVAVDYVVDLDGGGYHIKLVFLRSGDDLTSKHGEDVTHRVTLGK